MKRELSPSLKFPLTVSERIHALRIAANLNQHHLAEILDCSQGTISKLELGMSDPTLFQLIKFREYFGISADAFLTDQIDFTSVASKFNNYKFTLNGLYEKLNKTNTQL